MTGTPATSPPLESGQAPLPYPTFYWGVGIENCWMAQADPVRDGSRRPLDLFLQMQHYDRWQEDLDRAADLGVNAIRYSVPWYKAEPAPGVYDWSWIDGPVEYLVNKLRIIHIMDLIHYGTPVWMPDGVVDERFPEALAAYAAAMAKHFAGLVDHYTPHNEPQATCRFCGLWGRWPPYSRGLENWARIGIHVAKAIILETSTIREALPGAVLISADVALDSPLRQLLPALRDGGPQAEELRMAASLYPASLIYGKVDGRHVLAETLTAHGVSPQDIDWFYTHAPRPDVLGYNYYPDLFVPEFAAQGDFTRGASIPLEQAARSAAEHVNRALRQAHAWFGLPILLTETSAGLADEAKAAYAEAVCEAVRELRQEGMAVRGLNWWPLYETIIWEYREEADKPLETFLRAGGWNNGLYRIRPQADGTLRRVPTVAVSAFREAIRRSSSAPT